MATKTRAQVEQILRSAFPGRQAKAMSEAISEAGTKAATVAACVAAIPAAAPAGGTGAAAGGYDTAANRDLMIATVNGLRTDMIELQAQFNALLDALKAS